LVASPVIDAASLPSFLLCPAYPWRRRWGRDRRFAGDPVAQQAAVRRRCGRRRIGGQDLADEDNASCLKLVKITKGGGSRCRSPIGLCTGDVKPRGKAGQLIARRAGASVTGLRIPIPRDPDFADAALLAVHHARRPLTSRRESPLQTTCL